MFSYFRAITAIIEINQLNLYVGVCVKKSDVTLFVFLNIFISNCNLITHLFLVNVTNYNYFYFVIKLRNSITCKLVYSPTLHSTNAVIHIIILSRLWN